MKEVRALVVMGVSGCGKSTVGQMLAERLGWHFRDADSFHPPANIEKMSRGAPLDDDDRRPWLEAIAAHINQERAAGRAVVVACSALKRAYRDVLLGGRPDARLVYLRGTAGLIGSRMAKRMGHFMPGSLLASQFATLEEPVAAERAIVADVSLAPEAIVEDVIAQVLG